MTQPPTPPPPLFYLFIYFYQYTFCYSQNPPNIWFVAQGGHTAEINIQKCSRNIINTSANPPTVYRYDAPAHWWFSRPWWDESLFQLSLMSKARTALLPSVAQVMYSQDKDSRPSVVETNSTSLELSLPVNQDYVIQIKPFSEGGEGRSSRQITIPKIAGGSKQRGYMSSDNSGPPQRL